MKNRLNNLYNKLNRKEYIHPDPLEFLHRYSSWRDQEVVGLIVSSLAYGNVKQILRSAETALSLMHPSPYKYLLMTQPNKIRKNFATFKHRFADGREFAAFLIGIRKVLKKYGSLKDCFSSHLKAGATSVIEAMEGFVTEIAPEQSHLLPKPSLGSACKRLNLFLRWMVRSDDVDLGVWNGIPTSKLIIPLDTHMYNISQKLGFTKRRQANLKTAEEITSAFSKYSPEDPVKYDFALTRLGIRDDMTIESFFK